MPPKRKHLILQEKAEILELLKKGIGATFLSRKYGVAKSTISSIKNKRSQILKTVDNTFAGPGKRKTLKFSIYPKMEKALYKWFLKQKQDHLPINGEMIKEKAKSLQEKFYATSSFNASSGWLQKFKNRYGIRHLNISGVQLSTQPELISQFKEKLSNKIEEMQFSLEQIYNADESGLYWKLLPDNTYVSLLEKSARGKKTEKQRITFMACANATGNHKVKLLVIGKAKNPQTFKNFNCPVNYQNSKTAWMTTEIFRQWFKERFIPEVKEFLQNRGLPIKALLLLDNAPSHPPEKELNSIDECITVMCMPSNVTPLIQPMDQNAIRLFYRKNLLSDVRPQNDIGAALRDAVTNLNLAWIKLKPVVIQKCWHNILPHTHIFDDHEDETEVMNILQLINPTAYERNEIVTLNEDIQPKNEEDQIIVNDDDNDSLVIEPDLTDGSLISSTQAFKSLNTVLQWVEENAEEIEFSNILVLQDLRSKIVQKCLNLQANQNKLTSIF